MKLVVSDLSNIEGRVLAWVAGEKWKVEAFRAYDRGDGPDLYNITATSIIGGDPWKVKKKDRNVFGKVPDLACGFGGGEGAFGTFEKAYGVKMSDYWGTIQNNIDQQHIAKAKMNYTDWGSARAPDTPQALWIARDTVKLAWRARHPATVRLWYDVELAAKKAIRSPGQTFKVGKHLAIGVRKKAGRKYLLVKLPSGRYLCYFDPRLTSDGSISYMGIGTENEGSTVKAWVRLFTYGGKLVENIVQATARDVLYGCMPAAEAAGYAVVLHVHDELVTETADALTVDGLSKILAARVSWAPGLPLAAAGFEARRYKKED